MAKQTLKKLQMSNDGWGGEVINQRVPSGTKLVMAPDDDAILKFVGIKDISDRLGEDEGTALYAVFVDGKRIVSMPCSYALTESVLETGYWYYFQHQGEIDMGGGKNPMKDFLIKKLGVDGQVVQCPERVSDDKQLILADELIAVINYTRLNYPLRDLESAAAARAAARRKPRATIPAPEPAI